MNAVFTRFFVIFTLVCQYVSAGQLEINVASDHKFEVTQECDLVSPHPDSKKFGGNLKRVKYDEFASRLMATGSKGEASVLRGTDTENNERYSYAKLGLYFQLQTEQKIIFPEQVYITQIVNGTGTLIPIDTVTINEQHYGQITFGNGLINAANLEKVKETQFMCDSTTLAIQQDPIIYIVFSKKNFQDANIE